MKYYSLFCATCSIIALTGNSRLCLALDNHSQSTYTLELKPIPLSDTAYKTAASTFLPELENGDFRWNGTKAPEDYSRGNCKPTPNDKNCQYGTSIVANGCGGTRISCKSCNLPTCTAITSKPTNSSYTTSACTDCGGTKTINTGWSCNSEYYVSGNLCLKTCTPLSSESGCAHGTYSCSDSCGGTRTCCSGCSLPTCRDKISSKPDNSYYTTSACTDCGGTISINTSWSCNHGYEASGNSCVAKKRDSCIDPYSGYFNGTSCDTYAAYTPCVSYYTPSFLGCTIEDMTHSKGTRCDLDSWRRCCEMCNDELT